MHTNAHYDVPTELDHCLRQTVSVLGLDQLASSVFFGVVSCVKASQDCESLLWIWILKVEPALFGSKLMNEETGTLF